jgi:hypothetical protein
LFNTGQPNGKYRASRLDIDIQRAALEGDPFRQAKHRALRQDRPCARNIVDDSNSDTAIMFPSCKQQPAGERMVDCGEKQFLQYVGKYRG